MRTVAMLCMAVLMLFTVGCGMNLPDAEQKADGTAAFKSVRDLNPGITIYKASNGELRGSYRSGKNAVHFQTVRGENLVFGVNTIDPDAPAYSVSARILDQDGNPIAISFGGHDDRTSDWFNKVEGLGDSSPDLNTSFALAQEGVNALSQAIIDGFDEEIKVLKRRSVTAAPINPSSEGIKTQALTTWRYWIRMFRKDAWFNGNFADHSAVIVNETSPSGTIVNYVTCNHGTCADDASMQFLCQNVVYPAYQHVVSMLPCDAVSSYGFFSGQHVCNDDTLVQYNLVVYNNNDITTCTDSSLRLWAPGCF